MIYLSYTYKHTCQPIRFPRILYVFLHFQMYTASSDFYTGKCKFGSRLGLPVRDKENRRFYRADAHFRTRIVLWPSSQGAFLICMLKGLLDLYVEKQLNRSFLLV